MYLDIPSLIPNLPAELFEITINQLIKIIIESRYLWENVSLALQYICS